MQEKAVGRNISLYPTDWATVACAQAHVGGNRSQAIRFIIREWERLSPVVNGQNEKPSNERLENLVEGQR